MSDKNIKKLNDTNITKDIKNKESEEKGSTNIIFHCEQCKRIPLIIPSNINNKIIIYCKSQKKIELISPTNLSNMISTKNNKKKDNSKESLKINDNNLYSDEFLCSLHGRQFINYCKDCSKDICYTCSKEHFNHNLIYFSQILPSNFDIREGNKILAEMKKELEKFKQNTKEIIKCVDSLIYIKEIIINSLKVIDFKKLNYYSIMNYKNLLKLKIKLNEQLYSIINPLTIANSNLLEEIEKNFEDDINELSLKDKLENKFIEEIPLIEKSINKKNKSNYLKNNIENSYNNFLKILDKNFEKNIKLREGNIEEENENLYSSNSNKINNSKKSINLKYEHENDNIIKEIEINNNECDFLKENNKAPNISEFEKSKIMDNKEMNFIINLISSKFQKNIKKLYLCYRATKDGDKAVNFHQKCDYIKNIFILIKTKGNKKFGGFSSESWDNNLNDQTWKKDDKAFIFSLDDYNSYNIIKPNRAIICHSKFGPIFGNGEIFIYDNFFKFPSTSIEKNTYYESKGTSYPLNGGKEFLISEMEAYKVDFD